MSGGSGRLMKKFQELQEKFSNDRIHEITFAEKNETRKFVRSKSGRYKQFGKTRMALSTDLFTEPTKNEGKIEEKGLAAKSKGKNEGKKDEWESAANTIMKNEENLIKSVKREEDLIRRPLRTNSQKFVPDKSDTIPAPPPPTPKLNRDDYGTFKKRAAISSASVSSLKERFEKRV